MKLFLLLVFSLFTLSAACQPKPKKGLWSSIDVGVDKSVGKDQVASKEGVLNPGGGILYFARQQFEYPSARLRASTLFSMNSVLFAGIQSGITARFQSLYMDEKRFWVAIPIQLRVLGQVAVFQNSTLFLDGAAGINIQDRKVDRHREKTGPLISAGFLISKKRWFLRLGYEYQNDSGIWHIGADPRWNIVEEYIRYNTSHSLLYLSVGKNIFSKN